MRAKEMAQSLKKTLGEQLKAALTDGGPVNAITVCEQIALPLTDSVSARHPNASVRRTALRWRNPVNAPDEAARAIMIDWEAALASGAPAQPQVTRSGDETRVLLPILTESVCLKCHGDPQSFSPELTSSLEQLYPEDHAVDFNEGDLRGALVVTFEAQSTN